MKWLACFWRIMRFFQVVQRKLGYCNLQHGKNAYFHKAGKRLRIQSSNSLGTKLYLCGLLVMFLTECSTFNKMLLEKVSFQEHKSQTICSEVCKFSCLWPSLSLEFLYFWWWNSILHIKWWIASLLSLEFSIAVSICNWNGCFLLKAKGLQFSRLWKTFWNGPEMCTICTHT